MKAAEQKMPQQVENGSSASVSDPPAPKRRELSGLLEKVIDSGVSQEYARQMVEMEIARDLFAQDWALSKVFAQSGAFSDITGQTETQAISMAMAKIRLGRSWGINEADAMQFIFFTNGRPAVMNELFASKLRDAGYDWDIDWEMEETAGQGGKKRKACAGCTLWLKKWEAKRGEYLPVLDRKGNPISESFSKDDADNAMIWEKGKQIPLSSKWNFQSWARDMYFWRAITRIRRYHATNILRGAVAQVEAQDLPPSSELGHQSENRDDSIHASISLADVKPSTDPNRGHDWSRGLAATPSTAAPPAPEPVAKPSLKHLGQKNGVPIFNELPPVNTVPDGQKVFVRNPDGSESLHTFAADFDNQDGTYGAWLLSFDYASKLRDAGYDWFRDVPEVRRILGLQPG